MHRCQSSNYICLCSEVNIRCVRQYRIVAVPGKASAMYRVDAMLAWLNGYSTVNGLPQLNSLADVWKEHLGALGYLCHAQECRKKTFATSHDAFKDAKFVLEDLQGVKEATRKILHYQSVNFEAAADGSFLEIYKVTLLMLTEVLIYFRKCSDQLEETYYQALQDNALEDVFAKMMGQVISPVGTSWWQCDEINESLSLVSQLPALKLEYSATPRGTPRKSLCRPSLHHRLSTARKPSTSHSSPLKELFESPRMAELSHNKEVVKLKNRIEELIDEVASKEEQLRDVNERNSDVASECKNLKQRLKEYQHKDEIGDEAYTSLEKRYLSLKQAYNDAVSQVDLAKQRDALQKKCYDELEGQCAMHHQQMLHYKEQEDRLKSQLRDAAERTAILEPLENTLESIKIEHMSEISRMADELNATRTSLVSERKQFKEEFDKKVEYYEHLVSDIQIKFAHSEKKWNEEREKFETEAADFRDMLLAEQRRSDDSLRSLRENYDKEMERLKNELKNTSVSASLERQRYLNEMNSLNEQRLVEANRQRSEYEDALSSSRKQHDIEVTSVLSKLEIKDKMMMQQKEEIEGYKTEVKTARDKLMQSQDDVSMACKQELDLRAEWQRERLSWQEERLSLQTKLAQLDRYWRNDEYKSSITREDQNRKTTLEDASQSFSSDDAIMRATGGSEGYSLDETLICGVSEEPNQMEQRSIEFSKAESFFVSFHENDHEVTGSDRYPCASKTVSEATIVQEQIVDIRKPISFNVNFDDDEIVCEANGHLTADVDQQSFVSDGHFSSGRPSTSSLFNSEFSSGKRRNAPLTGSLWQKTDRDRVEVLKDRNRKVYAHLQSSYATEMADVTSPSASEANLKGKKNILSNILPRRK